MLVDENTNSWNPVVDGGRGGATRPRAELDGDVSGQESDKYMQNYRHNPVLFLLN